MTRIRLSSMPRRWDRGSAARASPIPDTRHPSSERQRGFEWSFRDQLIALLVAYMAWSAFALVVAAKKYQQGAVSPGDIIVEMWWGQGYDSDIDLWVAAPGERPVGYSNKAGVTFNLLRDDLGPGGDPESRNYEIAVGRGLKPGEYVVNVMLYRLRDGRLPVPVDVEVVVQGKDGGAHPILHKRVELGHEGEELTVARFSLDREGALVPGSVNDLPRPLRGQTADDE